MAAAIPIPSFDFYRRLSPRERVLVLLVGGAVLVLVNIVVLSLLLNGFRTGRRLYAEKSQDLRLQNIYAQEQPMWAQRMAWVKTRQPAVVDRARAGPQLLELVQGVARTAGVILTNPQIKPQAANPGGEKPVGARDYQAVTVEVDTESDWGALVHFIQTLQRPEAFVVFDLATLRSDPGDAARMKGKFSISKWYAPASK